MNGTLPLLYKLQILIAMNMRNLIAAFCLFAVFTSCKKEEDVNNPDAKTFQQTQELSDIKSENDQANADIDNVIDAFPGLKGGRIATDTTLNDICGCKIDRSEINNRKVTLKYDGITPCLSPSRVRSGNIVIELVEGEGWARAGAVIKVTYVNFRVTVERSGKTVLVNGVKYRKNMNGFNWLAFLLGQDSLVFRERGTNMQVTVNGNGPHSYNMARRTVAFYKLKQNRRVLHFKAYGDTTIGNFNNVDAWGSILNGQDYVNTFDEPWLADAHCWFSRPTAGKYTYHYNGNTVSVTLGVGTNGLKDPRDCAYGWKINWQNANGKSGERVLSY
jgi:hypothetical protein